MRAGTEPSSRIEASKGIETPTCPNGSRGMTATSNRLHGRHVPEKRNAHPRERAGKSDHAQNARSEQPKDAPFPTAGPKGAAASGRGKNPEQPQPTQTCHSPCLPAKGKPPVPSPHALLPSRPGWLPKLATPALLGRTCGSTVARFLLSNCDEDGNA